MNCEVPIIMQGWVVCFPLFNNFLVRFLWWKWQFCIKQMLILAVLLLECIEKYTFFRCSGLVLSDYHNIEFSKITDKKFKNLNKDFSTFKFIFYLGFLWYRLVLFIESIQPKKWRKIINFRLFYDRVYYRVYDRVFNQCHYFWERL